MGFQQQPNTPVDYSHPNRGFGNLASPNRGHIERRGRGPGSQGAPPGMIAVDGGGPRPGFIPQPIGGAPGGPPSSGAPPGWIATDAGGPMVGSIGNPLPMPPVAHDPGPGQPIPFGPTMYDPGPGGVTPIQNGPIQSTPIQAPPMYDPGPAGAANANYGPGRMALIGGSGGPPGAPAFTRGGATAAPPAAPPFMQPYPKTIGTQPVMPKPLIGA